MTAKPVLIVLHGPSGVGKDSVVNMLRERTGIYRATSTADRNPRPGEVEGVDYYFVTTEEFQRGIDAGKYVEWAGVYGELKGLRTSEIVGPLAEGRDIVIRTDVNGARTWRKKLEGATFIILVPEDLDALRKRLAQRGSESADEVERRLKEFDEEMADAPNNDYVVVNRDGRLEDTVREIEAIIARVRGDEGRPAPRLL